MSLRQSKINSNDITSVPPIAQANTGVQLLPKNSTAFSWVTVALSIVAVATLIMTAFGIAAYFAHQGKLPSFLNRLDFLSPLNNSYSMSMMGGGGIACVSIISILIGRAHLYNHKKSKLPFESKIETIDSKEQGSLMSAIEEGNLENFEKEISKEHPNLLEMVDSEGNNLLHLAVKLGQKEIVKKLLEIEPELITKDNDCKESPLHFAVASQNESTLEIITAIKAAIPPKSLDAVLNSTNNNRETPLQIACNNGNLEIIKLIVTANPFFNEIPIEIACKNGNLEIVKILVKANPFVLESGNTKKAFQIAAEYGSIEIVNWILTDASLQKLQYADDKLPLNDPIHLAIENKNAEEVIRLYQKKVYFDFMKQIQSAIQKGNQFCVFNLIQGLEEKKLLNNEFLSSALRTAIDLKKESIAVLILEKIQYEKKMLTIFLHMAMFEQMKSLVSALITKGASSTDYIIYKEGSCNALHIAMEVDDGIFKELCQQVKPEKFQHALKQENYPHSPSPLEYAILSNYPSALKIMHQNGAVLNTALLKLATKENKTEIAVYLVNQKVSFQSDKGWEDPFFDAIVLNNTSILEAMIQNGLDLSKCDSQGNSPFHYAILYDNKTSLELLMNKDPTLIDLKDGKGRTPLEIALDLNYEQILITLIKKGANYPNEIHGRSFFVHCLERNMFKLAKLLWKKGLVDLHDKTLQEAIKKIPLTLIYSKQTEKMEPTNEVLKFLGILHQNIKQPLF